MFIINIVYFHYSLSKLVNQWFLELLPRMNVYKFNFFLALFIWDSFFYENIARKFVSVNLLWTKYFLIFVCVYFLYYDTLKKVYHNYRNYYHFYLYYFCSLYHSCILFNWFLETNFLTHITIPATKTYMYICILLTLCFVTTYCFSFIVKSCNTDK